MDTYEIDDPIENNGDIPGMTKTAQNMQREIDANHIFVDKYVEKEKLIGITYQFITKLASYTYRVGYYVRICSAKSSWYQLIAVIIRSTI